MTSLDTLLSRPQYEVFPAKGTEQAVADWIPGGMTVTVSGTINVPRYKTNNVSRPRNRNRAKAYPASEQKKTWPILMQPAYNTELKNIRQNGISANTSR